MKKIAVVGSGISGLAAAWLLRQQAAVTLYESASRLGGHTNTVDVTLEGQTAPVDTGFLVHNDITYPNLIQLFEILGVSTYPTDMSFSVSIPEIGLEWAGTNLATVFAQKRNLLRPAFWGMVSDILRFNRQAPYLLQASRTTGWTLKELLKAHGFGQAFQDWYLIPMAAAIWSSPSREILSFPASTFITFCLNHHLLQVNDRPQWKTVINGARSYVEAMAKDLHDIRLSSPVTRVERSLHHVVVTTPSGSETFDEVVFACHAPTALGALADANAEERDILGAFRYQPNTAWLHTDPALLPKRKATWSAWNYLSGSAENGHRPVCVSYLLNKLQPLPFKQPVVVTLNPVTAPAVQHQLQKIEYAHPLFDNAAIKAQQRLAAIQGKNRAWFCGAWAGYGFHEDGLKSALRVAHQMGVSIPWNAVLN